jgi:DNA replication protein DnaC
VRKVNEVIQTRLSFHSDICDLHRYIKNGEEHIKKVNKMILESGEIVCPLCERENYTENLRVFIQNQWKEVKVNEKRLVFTKESMIADRTIHEASFRSFIVDCEESGLNLSKAKQAVREYKEGIHFNLILQGKPGAGKSHLAYSIATELNRSGEHTVLYVSMNELVRKIRSTFNKDSLETEDAIINKLVRVDYLILDDLGAESGNIDTNKQATDFVGRVMNGITDGRQDKSTIVTTNLKGETMKKLYDARIISRLFRNYRFIKFETTNDKRMIELPF